MREMDLLFREYIDDHLDSMDAESLNTLESFINEADVDIMNWILGRSSPSRSDYAPIVDTMRTLKDRHPASN